MPDIACAWAAQLVSDGRLVVPIVGAGGIGEIVAFAKREDELARVAATPRGLLPMRRKPKDP